MHILIDNLLTTYTSTTSGSSNNKTFLWLHGRQQSGNTFSKIIEKLPQYNHITVDLPGFGATALRSSEWGICEYAQFIKKFIDKLGLTNTELIVIGHSFGGRIALELLGKKMITPAHLILIGSAGIESQPRGPFDTFRSYFISWIKNISTFLRLDSMYEKIAQLFRSTDYNNSGGLKDVFLKTVNYDQSYLFPSIQIPTLLVRGSNDDQTPLTHGYIMQEMIPQTTLYITDGGHFTYQTHHDEIANKIHSFLTHHE